MFKRNQISTIVVAGLLTVSASNVFAQQDAGGTATVTVQNSFTFNNPTPIDFGTLRVTQPAAQVVTAGSATPAFVTIPSDGTPVTVTNGTAASATDNATINSIVDGAPAEFTITDAAPFTDLQITMDATGIPLDLTAAGTPSVEGVNGVEVRQAGDTSDNYFIIYALPSEITVVGGNNDGDPYNNTTPNLRTDGTGAVGFLLGARLAYNGAATSSPSDGAFTGTYTVEVSY